MGSTVNSRAGILNVSVKSSFEFGFIKEIVIKKGIVGQKEEIEQCVVQNLHKYDRHQPK